MSIKIVIVAGQEFSVPAGTDNEAIRAQLQGMGFADVATASVKESTRALDGADVPVVEFVKKAGTKGLIDALYALPPKRLPARGPTREQAARLTRLANGAYTLAQALDDAGLVEAIEAAQLVAPQGEAPWKAQQSRLDDIAPVAASTTPDGW